jgi:hypothetical protein
MKAATLILILTLSLSSVGYAQKTCAQNSYNTLGQFDILSNAAQHLTGNHTFNGGTAQICTYVSTGNPSCGVTASVQPYGVITDSGALTTTPLGYHVSNVAFNPGSQYNANGGATANGNSAGAVLWCLSSSCAVSVSANPVTFPTNSVWTHSPSFSVVCPAYSDPSYKPSCTGNPDFTCCGGSPTCSNGNWSCGGQGECLFANVPTDCTAGQYPQCQCSGSWQCVNNPGTPIVIDTDGTGFHLTSGASGVSFDLNGDGTPRLMSWTALGSGNAWLALPGPDGKITSGRQLFGNYTPQPPSPNPNGFLALAVYDTPEAGGNGDGVIDSRDAVWSRLRLWIDKNHDGISQPEELYTLSSLGVYSLALQYTETPFTDQFGNKFRYKGTVNPEGQPNSDRVDRKMYDVFLVYGNPSANRPEFQLTDKLQ